MLSFGGEVPHCNGDVEMEHVPVVGVHLSSHPDSVADPIENAVTSTSTVSKVTPKQLLARHPDLNDHFYSHSSNKLALKCPAGEYAYRFHPLVLRELISFAENPSEDHFKVIVSMLMEGWIMKSGARNPSSEIEDIYKSLQGSMPFSLNLNEIGAFRIISIGDWTWKVFSCSSLNAFPGDFKSIVEHDRAMRERGFQLLQSILDQPVVEIKPVEEAPVPSNLTPRKRATSAAAAPAPAPQPNLTKISSFFSVIKKIAAGTGEKNEFFPPFQLRPDSSMAPINPLLESRVVSRPARSNKIFRTVSHVHGSLKRKRCTCYGIDGLVTLVVWKLLQFCEDYRPAYYGTWQKTSAVVSGRRPFAKDSLQVDYDYDSEAEWADGAMEGDEDGESISNTDEEDEEDEDILDSEDDGWLVPDGYLSEGEGVDEAAAALPPHLNPDYDPGMDPSRSKPVIKTKKRLVVLKAKIHGPWVMNGPSWSVNAADSESLDPFLKTELSSDAIDYIKQEIANLAPSIDDLVAKLALKYGKLCRKAVERRVNLILAETSPPPQEIML